MKLALFHNLPSGGAKRHTLEQLKELSKRGHRIVEYAPSTADLSYCPFDPFVAEQHIYEAPRLALLQRRIPLLTPYLHAVQVVAHLERTKEINRRIAQEIDGGGHDLVLVKDCHTMPNPYVLRYLCSKSAFQCHHGGRATYDRLRKEDSMRASGTMRLKLAYYYPARNCVARHINRDEILNVHSATRVLTNSRFSEGVLSDLYGVEAHAIHPGIDTELFRPLNLPEADYVLSVGALIYSKGYRFLVSALAEIDITVRPQLFIAANTVDPGEERAVRAAADRAGVDLHIETITNSERLANVYNQARVFVYAPVQEALGLAPLEAMACGTSVVAVGEGGVRETVLDGVTGRLVERDTKAFSQQLRALLDDRESRVRMGRAGVEHVRSSWTWERAVDVLENHLREVAQTLR